MDACQLRTVVVQQGDFRVSEDLPVLSREDADALMQAISEVDEPLADPMVFEE